jgi:hypothetical protein
MTKLEKYLHSMAREIIDAETTNSQYFLIGDARIRLSDHTTNNLDADLSIVVPFNGGRTYMVTVKDSQRPLSWNAKQIIDFIPSIVLIKALKAPIVKVPKNNPTTIADKIIACKEDPELEITELVSSKLKLNSLCAAHRNVYLRSKSPWTVEEIKALPQMLHKDLGRGDKINDDVQIFLNCTSLTYVEFLNIYNCVVVKGKKNPTITLLQTAYRLLTNPEE